jgi:hypothetical protein
MKILFILCLLNCSFPIKIFGQPSVDTNFSFLKGIYNRSSHVLIPWGTSFSEIKDYGNPKIFCSTKTNNKIYWYSIYIFDSVRASFWTFYFRCFEKHKPTGKLSTIYGTIDSMNILKVKSILENYTKTQPNLVMQKNRYTYHWIIDDCYVNLGFDKRYGGFLNVQSKNKSYWR